MRDQIIERDRESSKTDQVIFKEQIRKTQEDLTISLQTLKSQLRAKRKKYTPEELDNK
jgi:hypothetical protein